MIASIRQWGLAHLQAQAIAFERAVNVEAVHASADIIRRSGFVLGGVPWTAPCYVILPIADGDFLRTVGDFDFDAPALRILDADGSALDMDFASRAGIRQGETRLANHALDAFLHIPHRFFHLGR